MLIEDAFKTWTKIMDQETRKEIEPEHYQMLDVKALNEKATEYIVNNYKEVLQVRGTQHFKIQPKNLLDVYIPFDKTFLQIEKAKEITEMGYRAMLDSFMTLEEDEEGNASGQVIWLHTVKGERTIFDSIFDFRITEDGLIITPGITENTIKLIATMDKAGIHRTYQDIIYDILTTLHILKTISNKTANLYKAQVNPTKTYRNSRNKQENFSNKPVYIYTDKTVNVKKAQSFSRGTPVQHITSWPVRGHWRRLDNPNKRGKNAKGEYVIEGRTWVRPHICGNKELSVRQRTYIALSSDASASSL